VKAAIEALLQEIPCALADGQIVQLGDLGSFRVTLQSEGTDTEAEFSPARVRKVKVNFVPIAYFDNLMAEAVLHRVEASTPAACAKGSRAAKPGK
jgi:predicted histone-like DNA-binding protein